MRKVIYSHHVSLDGFIEGPNRELDWVVVDEELHRRFNDLESTIEAHLYGRRVYEAMAAHLPAAARNPSAPEYEIEYARLWQNKPKIVFCKTLERVEWNSRLVRNKVGEEIVKLKRQPGKNMYLAGASLASTVIPLGLIDEYWLYVNQVILGGSTPMFPASDNRLHLRLLETQRFGCGVIFLRYQHADDRL